MGSEGMSRLVSVLSVDVIHSSYALDDQESKHGQQRICSAAYSASCISGKGNSLVPVHTPSIEKVQ